MQIERIDSSLVNFSAGLASAVGVNLLTGIVGTDGGLQTALRLFAVSVPWLVAGFFLWRAAAVIEHARRQFEARRNPMLTDAEIQDLERDCFTPARRPATSALFATGACLVIAVLLLVGLFGLWREADQATQPPKPPLVSPVDAGSN